MMTGHSGQTLPSVPKSGQTPASFSGIASGKARSRFDLSRFAAITRAAQIRAAMDNAFGDPDFRGFIAMADQARDRGDWGSAEFYYGSALKLFPMHCGYLIQYAHAIKEQGIFDRAEIYYRSAGALGASPEVLDEHLGFVARRNGVEFVRDGVPELEVDPLQAPPTMHDIRRLVQVFWAVARIDDLDALDLLRSCATNRAVIRLLVAGDRFAQCNHAFLELLRA